MAYLFEEMGETYTLGADGMYYPNLELPKEETHRFGKCGNIRHTFRPAYCKRLTLRNRFQLTEAEYNNTAGSS